MTTLGAGGQSPTESQVPYVRIVIRGVRNASVFIVDLQSHVIKTSLAFAQFSSLLAPIAGNVFVNVLRTLVRLIFFKFLIT